MLRGKGHGVGTEEQKHVKVKINDVVRIETSAVVESEVIAVANVGREAKTNIMISGRGGSKWRSKIGKSSIISVRQRDASGSGSKRQRDCRMGDEGRRVSHDRSRSRHMEDQFLSREIMINCH